MSIEDLIDQIYNQDFANAGPTFNELLQQKLTDALDQEKINVASQMFGDGDDEELEDISDEEIGEIVDDVDEEEEEEE